MSKLDNLTDRFLTNLVAEQRRKINARQETENGTKTPQKNQLTETRNKRKVMAALEHEYADLAEKVLSDRQKTRLKQIKLQLNGLAAFYMTHVAMELNLDDDQMLKLLVIRHEFRVAMKSFVQSHKPKGKSLTREQFHRFHASLHELSLPFVERSKAVLTAKQQKLLENMFGARIKFQRHQLSLTLRPPASIENRKSTRSNRT